MKSISLLDASIGIGTILGPQETPETTIPQSRSLASTSLTTTSLEATYAPSNIQTVLEEAICPDAGDGGLLIPSVFSSNLQKCKENLSQSNQIEIQNFLQHDLDPLIDNEALLKMYVSLMIEG